MLFDFAFANAVASLSKREILRDAITIVLIYASNFNEDATGFVIFICYLASTLLLSLLRARIRKFAKKILKIFIDYIKSAHFRRSELIAAPDSPFVASHIGWRYFNSTYGIKITAE